MGVSYERDTPVPEKEEATGRRMKGQSSQRVRGEGLGSGSGVEGQGLGGRGRGVEV